MRDLILGFLFLFGMYAWSSFKMIDLYMRREEIDNHTYESLFYGRLQRRSDCSKLTPDKSDQNVFKDLFWEEKKYNAKLFWIVDFLVLSGLRLISIFAPVYWLFVVKDFF